MVSRTEQSKRLGKSSDSKVYIELIPGVNTRRQKLLRPSCNVETMNLGTKWEKEKNKTRNPTVTRAESPWSHHSYIYRQPSSPSIILYTSTQPH